MWHAGADTAAARRMPQQGHPGADGRRLLLPFGLSAEASGDWGALDGARIAKAAEKAALRELEKQMEKRDAEFAAQARIASKAFGMMEKAE